MGELTTTKNLRLDGLGPSELRGLVRGGELKRVRRGSYRWAELELERSADDPESPAAARHRDLIAATVPLCASGSVISHSSAAVLWGLPLARVPDRVDVTRNGITSGQDRGCVHLRVARLDPSEVTLINGQLATTLARTVVDLARSLPLVDSVVPGDAALRERLGRQDLADVLELARGRPGVARARRACAFFDGRSVSGGESVSRVRLARAGLPAPELQFEIRTPAGELLGRSDFYWREHHTVGEFDGRAKYERYLRPGERPGDVVFAEKRREDAIRGLGLEVVRWTWDDLGQLNRLVGRVRQAFLLADRRFR